MNTPPEILEVYDLDSNFLDLMPRKKFYKEAEAEFAATGKITKKVKSVRVMLMTGDGRLYIQRRSKVKQYNRGLYDKTAGGLL